MKSEEFLRRWHNKELEQNSDRIFWAAILEKLALDTV